MRIENLTLITGNSDKVAQFQRYVSHSVNHQEIDLTEIQPDASLPVTEQLRLVVDRKAKDAYKIVKSPVVVDDVAIEMHAHKGWPGVNVKYELKTIGAEGICAIANLKEDRSATAHTMFGYYDGEQVMIFHGYVNGTIAEMPRGDNGFGWDKAFIPDGYDRTRGELSEEEYDGTSPRNNAAIELVSFLRAS